MLQQRLNDCMQQIASTETVLAAVRKTLMETVQSCAEEGSLRGDVSPSGLQFGSGSGFVRSKSIEVNNGAKALPVVDQVVAHAIMEEEKRRRDHPGKKTFSQDTMPFHELLEDKAHFVDPQTWYCMKCCWGKLSIPVFHPDHDFLMMWNCMGFVFLVYLFFALPVYMAYDTAPQGLMFIWASVMDTFFILDVCLNFGTGYMDKGGTLVTCPARIGRKYVTSWFVLDVAAAIPWDWLPSAKQDPRLADLKGFRFLRVLRVAKVSRLFRLFRDSKLKDRIDIITEASPALIFLYGVTRILFLLCGITHWTACAWYVVGTMPGQTDTWVEKHLSPDATLAQRYVYSLYFTLTTMTTVGYGDIAATNFTEVCFVLVLLLVASIVFAGLMGALTDLIGNLNSSANAMAEKKRFLSQYMRWRGVPYGLFCAVRQHLIFVWSNTEGYDTYEEEIKVQLSPVLRKELSYHVYGMALQSAPFLSWMRHYPASLKELATNVYTKCLAKGDHIFRVGDSNTTVFILLQGKVRLSLNQSLYAAPVRQDEDEEVPAVFNMLSHVSSTLLDLQARVAGNKAKAEDADKDNKEKTKTHDPEHPDGAWDHHHAARWRCVFESKILNAAHHRLRHQGQQERIAARMIQRSYRKSRNIEEYDNEAHQEKVKKKRAVMKSSTVDAPAYFGEACLWEPFDAWDQDNPCRIGYSARCETRIELLNITRQALKDTICSFSPWLRADFEFFQKAVLEEMGQQPSLDSSALQELKRRTSPFKKSPGAAGKKAGISMADIAVGISAQLKKSIGVQETGPTSEADSATMGNRDVLLGPGERDYPPFNNKVSLGTPTTSPYARLRGPHGSPRQVLREGYISPPQHTLLPSSGQSTPGPSTPQTLSRQVLAMGIPYASPAGSLRSPLLGGPGPPSASGSVASSIREAVPGPSTRSPSATGKTRRQSFLWPGSGGSGTAARPKGSDRSPQVQFAMDGQRSPTPAPTPAGTESSLPSMRDAFPAL